jgi:riboflavin kinase/FMN adenylyltransferase
MQIEEELSQVLPQRETLLTIGTFDGVHIGHKYLIAQLKAHAKSQNLLSGVITFRQHPRKVLSSQADLAILTSLEKKIELIKNEGVDVVIPLSFTPEVGKLSAREFVSLLKKYLRMKGLVVGYDFSLGRNREGDHDTLCKVGKEMGFNVIKAYSRSIHGEIVSSTAIRKALSRGDKELVFNMLGWGKELEVSRTCSY